MSKKNPAIERMKSRSQFFDLRPNSGMSFEEYYFNLAKNEIRDVQPSSIEVAALNIAGHLGNFNKAYNSENDPPSKSNLHKATKFLEQFEDGKIEERGWNFSLGRGTFEGGVIIISSMQLCCAWFEDED